MELCVPSHRASNKCNVHVKLLDLRLQPGATQANCVQSADAILAYQQALVEAKLCACLGKHGYQLRQPDIFIYHSKQSKRESRRVLRIVKNGWSCFIGHSFQVLAFRDISPQAPMHILIIPKSNDGLTGLSKVKPASENWATEYQQQYNGGASWADEFVHDEVFRGPDHWANEFGAERLQQESVDDQWVNEFSKLHVDDWAEEFGRQVGEGALGDSSSDNWANSYDEFLNEQLAAKQRSDASRGVYVFSDMNPYVGHQNPLKEGQELFRKGLLSEAVLALEAEVMKNPENAEGWRLLGITHAENDDDQQAIAAMMRAQEADPTNLEVLLALGVSHTNELEQTAALKYLYGWLRHHPKYGTLAPPELANSLYYADVARLFNEAAQMSPEDADVHIVLGVLYNLSREYDKAIASFKTALKLKPNDYSLWNKLGATQANSVQSADAILAYQQALDLKPNYVRAWANMGISYANQGMYEESIRYYVRALAMNPKADNAWQYLRISLSCVSRNDMVEACDSRNLELLQKEFPL